MKRIILLGIIFFGIGWGHSLLTDSMTGGEFEITADSFSFIDGGEITGGQYSVFGTGGEIASSTSGGIIDLRSGFQAAEVGSLNFSLDSSSVALGTLSEDSIASGSIVVTVTTDSETGYTVSMTEDGNLRSSGHSFNDVNDGSVSLGSEEYGIRTSGNDGLLSSDTAITNNLAVISGSGTINNRATTVTFRAVKAPATPAGSYSHTVTFITTVNP